MIQPEAKEKKQSKGRSISRNLAVSSAAEDTVRCPGEETIQGRSISRNLAVLVCSRRYSQMPKR